MRIYCNPLNLPYKYQHFTCNNQDACNREAADPSLVCFKGQYYLFLSMTAGFLVSDDLAQWSFHPYLGPIPIYDYAPDVIVRGDWLYFCASRNGENCSFYRSRDPLHEPFEEIQGSFPFWDPHQFLDDDGRLYFYWGCSNERPIYGTELDPETLLPLHERCELIFSHTDRIGYERNGDDHSHPDNAPWIEGPWMTKHNGLYYLQYAAPATECNVYCDAVYMSDKPLGPFTLAMNNPFSYQPGGFITGAGHGSTLKDLQDRYWHVASMRISRNHLFERRIGLWRSGFDEDGTLWCDQRYGDWPRSIDEVPWQDPRWMLLSYAKPARASSGEHPELAVNEDVRTWWSADSAKPGQWLEVDLTAVRDVRSIQINFADEAPAIPDGAVRTIDQSTMHTRWLLEGSLDGTAYFIIEDKRGAMTDLPHDLIVREEGLACRYLRLTITELPYDQPARISGLRVFGLADESKPGRVSASADRIGPMDVRVHWFAEGSNGVCIHWGHEPDKLYHSYMVYGKQQQIIGSLMAGQEIYLRVDAFNEGGITRGSLLHLL